MRGVPNAACNMKRLCVHSSGRYLTLADGTPFFLLGDTAWHLLHNLTREETEHYLDTRLAQGFNFVQTVALAECDGLRVPNVYGHRPLGTDEKGAFSPLLPQKEYFDHVEWVITAAEERGMYIGLLPTWGDKFNLWWGKGPEIFTPDNAEAYGRFLGERFCHHENLVWVLGGDRPPETPTHHQMIERMARGLTAGDGGKFLKTYHPQGQHTSGEYWHTCDWLDFNMMQSGHDRPAPPCYALMAKEYARVPAKPVMDGEPCYEDIPVNVKPGAGFWYADAARRAAWWNLMSGACGHTYGHHAVWQMNTRYTTYCPFTWRQALTRPAATQMRVLRAFAETYPPFGGTPLTDAVEHNEHGDTYVAALGFETCAYLYCPRGMTVRLTLPFAPTAAEGIDPKTGDAAAVILDGDTLTVHDETVVIVRK